MSGDRPPLRRTDWRGEERPDGVDWVASVVGEGVHAGLRKFADSSAAADAWRAIAAMPDDEWSAVVRVVAESLRNEDGPIAWLERRLADVDDAPFAPCAHRGYRRDGQEMTSALARSVPCDRPADVLVVDEWRSEQFYACAYHGGRAKRDRTTVHVLDRRTGACISCRDTVVADACDVETRLAPRLRGEPDSRCPRCGRGGSP